MAKRGVLLVNLGTPAAPTPGAVRRYLRAFLGDPRVLDGPAWLRWLLLHVVILPRRPRRSAEAYARIWTDAGSPLLVHGERLRQQLAERVGGAMPVALAMRYGVPSIRDRLRSLAEVGVDRVTVMPLFPHYATSSWGSAVANVYAEAARCWNTPSLQVVPPYFDHPDYLELLAARVRPLLTELRPDKVVISFHGLPVRQLRKSDPAHGAYCLRVPGCCERMRPENGWCYRAQCMATARGVAARLRLAPDHYLITFQSRLGREPWIEPYTDVTVRTLARQGIRRVVILSPSFVADCLETLEEIGILAARDFVRHGGERLVLVPALNSDPAWVDVVAALITNACREKNV